VPSAPVGPYQPWRYLYRVPTLLVLGVVGLPVLLAALLPGIRDIPVAGRGLGWRVQRRYARLLVRATGVRMRIIGDPPPSPALVVANHISGFDIPLLHALAPMWLVAKHDIRDWPLVGWLASVVGTIFIARGDESSRRRAARRMTALLKKGRIVGLFPEGGIRPERGVNRFHARLLSPAVRAGVPLVPVAIRYWRDGDVHDERVFGPGMTFSDLALSALARPPCDAQLFVGRPLDSVGVSRRELALSSQARVTEMYGHAAAR
jgi:1-acyl-sn-glycerol-3-phosphate acyltransferase